MLTVTVPGMISLSDTILALKYVSYHDAEARGSDDLMWT
jgi:hypothetical protein